MSKQRKKETLFQVSDKPLLRRYRWRTAELSIERAYRRFADAYPRWAASLFDRHFLRQHARPFITDHIAGRRKVTAHDLAAAWITQLHWPGAATALDLTELLRVAAGFLHMLDEELGAPRDVEPTRPGSLEPADELANVLALYAKALRDGSNHSLEWLWLAAKLPLPLDRRFCLERALAIDPDCPLARKALAQFEQDLQRGGLHLPELPQQPW